MAYHDDFDQKEVKKVIITGSRTLIAWQCLVHVAPILTTSAVFYVNFRRIYIGVDFPGMTDADTIVLMLLQLSAKLHEVMIVASLSQVIWHAVRYELLYGEGLPLGLIGSGLSFSSLEFFLKKDFYGSLQYLGDPGPRLRRVGFVALLIGCGMTAILAGPASAVLLVPKADTFSAGGTNVYLNGSDTDFWPADLSGEMSELEALCAGSNSTSIDVCPGGGFGSLLERWSNVDYHNPLGNRVPSFANDLSGSRFYWPVHGPSSRMPPLYVLGDPRTNDEKSQPYTWLVQTHAAAAVLLERVSKDWWTALLSSMRKRPTQVNDRNVKANVRSAFAAVRCTGAQNLSAASRSVLFPSVTGRWDWAEDLSLDIGAIQNTSSDSLHFQWVHLPDEFGVVSIGGLLELPRPMGTESRLVVGCTAQTGWVPTTARTDAYVFWSGWYPFGIFFGERTPSWTAVERGQSLDPTNGRIHLGTTWLNMLTPLAPIAPAASAVEMESSPSTIEVILAAAKAGSVDFSPETTTQIAAWASQDLETAGGRRRLLETIVANVLTDGLSRCGSHRVFQNVRNVTDGDLFMYDRRSNFNRMIMQGDNALQIPDIHKELYSTLQVSMLISGYAFQSSLPAYLAVSVLSMHAVLAAAHMAWLIARRRTSRTWDSVAELIALAQNSAPSRVLDHTSAGIERWSTFSRIAHIRVAPASTNTLSDSVELVFAEPTDREGRQNDHELEEIESLPEMTAESPSISTSIPQAWTFPITSRKFKSKAPGHTHLKSDSTEKLILPRHSIAPASNLVEINRLYD